MNKYYLGIDCGSVSMKVVIADDDYNILWGVYERTNGAPVEILKNMLNVALNSKKLRSINSFSGIFTTGSGRFTIANAIGGEPFNEISTHGTAGGFFYPEAKTIIEIGGQDSKLIMLDKMGKKTVISDSQMNDVCAAGTGSFLDQQAYRMGISVEELSERACYSTAPAKISGRCSVFAKTDMIHLQQDGTAIEDISYGLCLAVVRTYVEDLVKGRILKGPILFQGGVANNKGIKKAFIETLNLEKNDLLIPENFDLMGAIGAIICGREKKGDTNFDKSAIMEKINTLDNKYAPQNPLQQLKNGLIYEPKDIFLMAPQSKEEVFLGVDIGSVSVKLVAINRYNKIIFKYYDKNNANPLQAIKIAFTKFTESVKNIKVLGVGVTGSGREYIGKCINADVIKNEITAQAYGTKFFINDADVIVEIGGQDSKYIRLENGHIKDFVMNKTCAAGTGSFLSEQADRLNIDINEFSSYAMASVAPINVGSRCTIFMETDCIHHQQKGTQKEDIVAGLSYSIAKNYLEKVAMGKTFDGKVVIQGGIAYNKAVVAAFSNLLKKEIIVVPHHEVTGALGMALIAKDEMANKDSCFVGFNLDSRIKEKRNKICQDCSNFCNLTVTEFTDGSNVITGSVCGKYEISKKNLKSIDYFKQRQNLLLSYYKENKESSKGTIGIPRMLLFHELFPMWVTFFQELGYKVVLSNEMSKEIYQKAISRVLVDTCYPIRCIYGMVNNLLEKNVDYIYIPYVLSMYDDTYKTKYAHNCQYIQQIPDLIKASLGIQVLSHTLKLNDSYANISKAFRTLGSKLLIDDGYLIDKATSKGIEAQKNFENSCRRLGEKALEELNGYKKIFALIGHPYIIHDPYFNLNIAKKLGKLGIQVLPADILPIDNYDLGDAKKIDLSWKSNNRAVNIAEYILQHNQNSDSKILPVFMTQFGCAADSMLTPYLRNIMGRNPYLEIEVDEHNSIAGILTRCEAFWDSVTKSSFIDAGFIEKENLDVKQTMLSEIRKHEKTIYIYPICESIDVLPYVMQKHGIRAEMIPKTTKETNELGKRYANEKHCRTFQVMVGDLVKLIQRKDFEDSKSAILMFDYEEACRFSLFKSLYYKVLCEQGAKKIEFISTTIDDPLGWLKQFGVNIALDIWTALVCADYLYRYKFLIRPFEKEVGETDKMYEEARKILFSAIIKNKTVQGFKVALETLCNVPMQDRDLMFIGVTGDAFTRVHEYGMKSIFSAVEQLGGVIVMPPSWNDFISYGSDVRSNNLMKERKIMRAIFNEASSRFMYILKQQIQKIAVNYSKTFLEPSNKELTMLSEQYVNTAVAPVIPSMFVGKTVDMVTNKHVDGLINAYGFNCCLGKITTACVNDLRKEYNNLPMFNFIDDGLEQTNTQTRLESFMEQVQMHKLMEVV